MKGKKGLIFGVSNTHGIAYGIAKQIHDAGGEIAFTYANEAMEKRVRPIAEEFGAKIIMECDVTNEDHVKAVFAECEKVYGKLDFVVHAVAFANKEDLLIHQKLVGIWHSVSVHIHLLRFANMLKIL